MKHLLFPIGLLVLFVFACKKEDVPKSELIVNNVWKINALKQNDSVMNVPACSTDDKLSFSAGGGFELNYGIKKCSTVEGDALKGNWSIEEAENTLTLVSGTSKRIVNIVELSKDKLVIKYSKDITLGSTVVVEETYIP